jgi:hypothetical protein
VVAHRLLDERHHGGGAGAKWQLKAKIRNNAIE